MNESSSTADPPNFMACLRHLCEQLDPRTSCAADHLPKGLSVHHQPGLAFSSSDIARIQRDDAGGVTVWANFLGLTDSQSPIPDYMTHDLMRCDERSKTTRDFLNIFHHRLYELLFFGLQAQDLAFAWSRDQDPRWKTRVQALLGLAGTTSLPDSTLATALLWQTPSAAVIEQALLTLLAPFLRATSSRPVTFELKEFCGSRVPLDRSFQNRLGRQHHCLGKDCVLGDQVIDRASKIEIVVKNLDEAQLRAFEAQGSAHKRLAQFMAAVMDRPIDIELVLQLHPQAAARKVKKAATLGQGQQILAYHPQVIERCSVQLM